MAARGSPNEQNTPRPGNAAKSVLAAAYCQSSARERGLDLRVTSAGTDAADGVSPPVLDALRQDGIDVSRYRPRRVTREDMATAWRIISLGCELAELPPTDAEVQQWDDVPATNNDLAGARAAIRTNVAALIDAVERSQDRPGEIKREG